MTTPAGKPGPKTVADWLAQPEDARLELIDGELVEKAAPSTEHLRAQLALEACVHRAVGGESGWWVGSEIVVALDGCGYRPAMAGWQRKRMPDLPESRPVVVRPDFICEIIGKQKRAVAMVKKLRRYHQSGVPHYWILDQQERTLTVHRHGPDGYLIALRAEAEERVRAEPFDAIELHVAVLLGDDPD